MFDPELAEIRFGTGLSPDVAPPDSVRSMMDRLRGPDDAGREFPIPSFEETKAPILRLRDLRRERNRNRGTEVGKKAEEELKRLRGEFKRGRDGWVRAGLARNVWTGDGLRERLMRFWADHFTARGRGGVADMTRAPYAEEAIRPHVAAPFGEMLIAAVTHELMLVYLDQHQSVGPGTAIARKKGRGLNENLAREVLELHTLGVGGPYDQADVRQLAELFTGLALDKGGNTEFRANWAEPGAETVLGRSYGGETGRMEDIHAVLRDLAAHPATADHIARKMAVHFVSDSPDPALVAALAARYRDTGGDLGAVTEALLEHPAAWKPDLSKAKQPYDFITSAMRALAVHRRVIDTASRGALSKLIVRPLLVMGQAWDGPPGPDGWPENAAAWVTPQGLAGRIGWAMAAPRQMVKPLPDPRDFVTDALGRFATQEVRFAAKAAESRSEGIGVVLASPAFQLR